MGRMGDIFAVAGLAKVRLVMLLACWGAGAGTAYWFMMKYEGTPGRAAEGIAMQWPAQAEAVKRVEGEATLVMAAHPGCPCSRASVAEIGELMARHPGKMVCYVLFAEQPAAGVGEKECEASDLWKAASAIPGVTCVVDRGDLTFHVFGARTSGQVFLYDAQGALRFSGGITGARDHIGPNAGLDAVTAFFDTGRLTYQSTPVFGCALR